MGVLRPERGLWSLSRRVASGVGWDRSTKTPVPHTGAPGKEPSLGVKALLCPWEWRPCPRSARSPGPCALVSPVLGLLAVAQDAPTLLQRRALMKAGLT